jgi:RND family efflux transporter MFP subunit
MLRKTVALLILIVTAGMLAGYGPQAQDAEAKKPEKAAKPGTCKVEKGHVKAEVSLKGIVEAEQMAEVSVKPEAWAMPLAVKKAVPHGTTVKKGDVVIQLDLDKIDQAIKDLKADRALAALAIKQAEEELPVLEKSLPLDLSAAERAAQVANEDLKKFTDVDRPLAEESAKQTVKSATHYLEYAKEELRQLEKMYRSKDLTEETEEIILKRQRHQVESADFNLKTATIKRDQTLKVDMPRKAISLREDAAKLTVALEKARHTLPLTVNQKRLALNKLKYDNERTAERLVKLEKDHEAMTVRAPADGIVYYGRCQNGQWHTATMVAGKLQPGGVVMPDEVLMTVVTPRPFFIHATVEEKDLHWLRTGMKGKALVTGSPDLKLPAKIAQLSGVPQTPGTFSARVTVEAGADADALMPGMACTVKIAAYNKKDVLNVPKTALFSDDDEEHYVYLAAKDGKPEKRTVKVGKTAGDKTEIIEGLKEGDEILTAKPEDK